MPKEIERKFLINPKLLPRDLTGKSYIQGYLSINNNGIVRVRKEGDISKLTIKSHQKGISRDEFEYQIPINDADKMLQLCEKNIVKKIRYKTTYNGKIWEIDEFQDDNKGLWIAEIELSSENENFDLPDWIILEVTNNKKYFNSYLSQNPYLTW
tara:strand:- start:202 stop:663 length:462 start_codon:yes stop_codon:yes gene_type:complete